MTESTKLEHWLNNKSQTYNWKEMINLIEDINHIPLFDQQILLSRTFEYSLKVLQYNDLKILNKKDPSNQISLDNIDLINLIDNIFIKLGKKSFILTNENIFKLEKSNFGIVFLKKNNINLFKKNYLEFKFHLETKEIISNYLDSHKYDKLNDNFKEFIDLIVCSYNNTKMNPSIWKNIIGNSHLFFYSAIKIGYQPSQNEILNSFCHLWNNSDKYRLEEFLYFSEAFAKTNVFMHSFSFSKDINKSLKNFFKPVMTLDSHFGHYPYSERNKLNYLEKEKIFFNQPIFLYKNFEKKLSKQNSLNYFDKNKNKLSKEDNMIIQKIDLNHNSIKTKKVKI